MAVASIKVKAVPPTILTPHTCLSPTPGTLLGADIDIETYLSFNQIFQRKMNFMLEKVRIFQGTSISRKTALQELKMFIFVHLA